MKSAIFAVLFTVSQAYQLYFPADLAQDALQPAHATPGALQATLSTASVNKILSNIPMIITEVEKIQDSITIPVNINQTVDEFTITGTEVTLENLSIDSAGQVFVNGTDTLRTFINNLSFDLTSDAIVNGPLVNNCGIEKITVSNFTLELELNSTSTDDLTFTLDGDFILSLEDLSVKVSKKLLQPVVNPVIEQLKTKLDGAFNFVSGAFDGALDAANQYVATHPELIVDVKGLPLNLTLSTAPRFSAETETMELHVDATVNKDDSLSNVSLNSEYAAFADQPQSAQLWLHESTLSSLLYAFGEIDVSSTGVTDQLVTLLHELYTHYGADLSCAVAVQVTESADTTPIKMVKDEGLYIGDAETGLPITAKIRCAESADAEKEDSIDLALNLSLRLNAAFEDFVYHASVDSVSVMGTKATSHIGELEYHAWDPLLQSLIKDVVGTFNLNHETPVDLKKKSQLFSVLAMIFQDVVVSPAQVDENLFAGFKLITDDL